MPIECPNPDRERRKIVDLGGQKSGAFELEADHERIPGRLIRQGLSDV